MKTFSAILRRLIQFRIEWVEYNIVEVFFQSAKSSFPEFSPGACEYFHTLHSSGNVSSNSLNSFILFTINNLFAVIQDRYIGQGKLFTEFLKIALSEPKSERIIDKRSWTSMCTILRTASLWNKFWLERSTLTLLIFPKINSMTSPTGNGPSFWAARMSLASASVSLTLRNVSTSSVLVEKLFLSRNLSIAGYLVASSTLFFRRDGSIGLRFEKYRHQRKAFHCSVGGSDDIIVPQWPVRLIQHNLKPFFCTLVLILIERNIGKIWVEK